MCDFGPWHVAGFFGYLLVFSIPVAIVLKRVGYSPWIALISAIPVLNFVMLWLFAFAPWPRDPSEQGGRA